MQPKAKQPLQSYCTIPHCPSIILLPNNVSLSPWYTSSNIGNGGQRVYVAPFVIFLLSFFNRQLTGNTTSNFASPSDNTARYLRTFHPHKPSFIIMSDIAEVGMRLRDAPVVVTTQPKMEKPRWVSSWMPKDGSATTDSGVIQPNWIPPKAYKKTIRLPYCTSLSRSQAINEANPRSVVFMTVHTHVPLYQSNMNL